jgi:hypothetical protein
MSGRGGARIRSTRLAKPDPVRALCEAQEFRYVAVVPIGNARSVRLNPSARAILRIILRAAAIAGVALALSSPARAACRGNCEPSVEVARAAMQEIFRQTFLSPYTLISFERLDGRSGERYGGVFYEMRIRAVLHYEGIRLRCRRPSCPELHHYLMENDAAGKKVTVAGWLFLELDGDEWKTVPLTLPSPQ